MAMMSATTARATQPPAAVPAVKVDAETLQDPLTQHINPVEHHQQQQLHAKGALALCQDDSLAPAADAHGASAAAIPPSANDNTPSMLHVLTDTGDIDLGNGMRLKLPLWYDDLARTGAVPRRVHLQQQQQQQ